MSDRTRAWLLLLFMICVESLATLMLKQSEGFQHTLPALSALLGYLVVLFLLSYVLRVFPASLAYAVWTGLGTLLVVVAGWIVFGESLTLASLLGIALITVGVISINRVDTSQP